MLLMDGHKSHLSTRIIKQAMDHGIHLECLPPHTTTILQPLDVVTLSKLKQSWKKLLSNHFKETNSQALSKQKFALLISKLFKDHLLPAHCTGGFAKAGIYPFDKRAISKEKLLQPATTSEKDVTIQSNTINYIGDEILSTNTSNLRRSSSCPNISSNNSSLIPNSNSLSTSNNVDTKSPTIISTSSIDMDTSSNPNTIKPSTINILSPISISNLDNEKTTTTNTSTISTTSTTTNITTSTNNTNASSILSDAMKALYSHSDEPAFPESIFSQSPPSLDVILFNTNSSTNENVNDSFSNNEHQQQIHAATNVQSSSTPVANSETPNRLALEAITNAINNHMKPTITTTNGKRKQIERPYGESITSIDAYVKIQNQEKSRKKRATKENNTEKDKAKPKQSKSTRGRKKKASADENEESLDNNMDVQNIDQRTLNIAPFNPYHQQNGLYSLSSNMNNSYDPRLHHIQQNPHCVSYQTCFKCYNLIYFNFGQFYKCMSCTRLCCASCMSNYSYPTSYYQCEYCCLNVALQGSRC